MTTNIPRRTEGFIDVPGGRLFAVAEGDGPPILLLHAGIADLRSWDAMAPYLIDAGYRVLRYDQRDAGRSSVDVDEWALHEDVVSALNSFDVDRAVIVGNSRGGMVAFDTALTHPERVVAIVGVAAAIGGYEGTSTPEEDLIFAEMDAADNTDPPDVAAITEVDVRAWVDGPGQPTTRVPAAIREAIREQDGNQYAPGRNTKVQAIKIEPRASDRVGELRVPILAIAGGLDFGEVTQAAQFLEANAANARAEVWPDVAHMIGMEQPERLASAITTFVEPLRPWS